MRCPALEPSGVLSPPEPVLAAQLIHQGSDRPIKRRESSPSPQPSYQNTDLIKLSQNTKKIVSSSPPSFDESFVLLITLWSKDYITKTAISSLSWSEPTNRRWALVSRDESQPMAGEVCPGGRGEDLSWSVSAQPATNISNNNNNAEDQ